MVTINNGEDGEADHRSKDFPQKQWYCSRNANVKTGHKNINGHTKIDTVTSTRKTRTRLGAKASTKARPTQTIQHMQ